MGKGRKVGRKGRKENCQRHGRRRKRGKQCEARGEEKNGKGKGKWTKQEQHFAGVVNVFTLSFKIFFPREI